MKSHRRAGFRIMVSACVILTLAFSAVAAQEVRWEVPPEVKTIDYTAKNLQYRTVFLEDGLAHEVLWSFALLREKVSVQGKLPEAGRFTVSLAGDGAQVELKEVDATTVDVIGKLALLSPREVRERAKSAAMKSLSKQSKEASQEAAKKKKAEIETYLLKRDLKVPDDDGDMRSAYADRRTIELAEGVARDALKEFASQRPEWTNKTEQERWVTATDSELFEAWLGMLGVDHAQEHLKLYGLQVDLSRNGSNAIAHRKLLGLYLLMTGQTARSIEGGREKDKDREAALQAQRSIGADEIDKLRKSLIVPLVIRFRPFVDDKDANSQWFHSQRVLCQARGVSTVRVEGKLDAGKQDRVDWWTLSGYDAASVAVTLPKDVACRYEIFPDKDVSRLRVIATGDGPVSYHFEFRPTAAPPSERTVVIRESASLAGDGFPY